MQIQINYWKFIRNMASVANDLAVFCDLAGFVLVLLGPERAARAYRPCEGLADDSAILEHAPMESTLKVAHEPCPLPATS